MVYVRRTSVVNRIIYFVFITLSNYHDIKLLLEYFLATVKAYIQILVLITVIESAK